MNPKETVKKEENTNRKQQFSNKTQYKINKTKPQLESQRKTKRGWSDGTVDRVFVLHIHIHNCLVFKPWHPI